MMGGCIGGCAGSRPNSDGGGDNSAAQARPVVVGHTPAPSRPARYLPRVVIYKTNGDYSPNVPVVVTPDGQSLVSEPGPGDVSTASEPVALKGGWLWDRRGGIGPGTRFLTYTYAEYHALPQVPDVDVLMSHIIPGARVTEAYRLPILQSEATAEKIDSIIARGMQFAEPIVTPPSLHKK